MNNLPDKYLEDNILKPIMRGCNPPTLGSSISLLQFNRIADVASINIHRWGWDRYVEYVEEWKLKVTSE